MNTYRTTYTVLPPTLYSRLLQVNGIEDKAKSLRKCVSFGATIPKPGETLQAEEIIAYCKMKLPRFNVPKYILIVNEFPRNPTGKLLKKELRKMYKDLALQEKT